LAMLPERLSVACTALDASLVDKLFVRTNRPLFVRICGAENRRY
jgi:hypothetical protein